MCLRRLSFPWRWRGNPDVAMALSHKQFLLPYSCLKEYHSISEKWRLSAQLRPLTAPLIQFQFLVGSGRGRTPRLGAPEGGFTALSGPGTVPLTDDGANQRRNNLELPSLPLNLPTLLREVFPRLPECRNTPKSRIEPLAPRSPKPYPAPGSQQRGPHPRRSGLRSWPRAVPSRDTSQCSSFRCREVWAAGTYYSYQSLIIVDIKGQDGMDLCFSYS